MILARAYSGTLFLLDNSPDNNNVVLRTKREGSPLSGFPRRVHTESVLAKPVRESCVLVEGCDVTLLDWTFQAN